MVGEVAASWGGVSAVRQGSFGLLSADVATSLAMIVTELCQNAVEHGLADRSGQIRVVPTTVDGRLRVEISDDGRGLPPDFDWRTSRSLGLSIVGTLVAELEGSFELGPQPDGRGTRAVVDISLGA
jgi:two-component sensor histidine kinase